MGSSASKAAGRVAQRTTAAAAAAKTPSGPLPPASNISASEAAAEASAKVRPPTFTTPASAHDLAQQQFLRQQQPQQQEEETMQEMPDDLLKFLHDAGPLQKQERKEIGKRQPREPRMPRQPWNIDDTVTEQTPSRLDGRQQESMPLAEKIEGFEVTKTTSFSRKTTEMNPNIYQKGTTLDMYHLLSQKTTTSADDGDGDVNDTIVEQTYQAYGLDFPLPDNAKQEEHKQLLANTLKYLDLPVIMRDYKDNEDSYDGIFPDQVEAYKSIKLDLVPKERARLVVEDLYERDLKQSS